MKNDETNEAEYEYRLQSQTQGFFWVSLGILLIGALLGSGIIISISLILMLISAGIAISRTRGDLF